MPPWTRSIADRARDDGESHITNINIITQVLLQNRSTPETNEEDYAIQTWDVVEGWLQPGFRRTPPPPSWEPELVQHQEPAQQSKLGRHGPAIPFLSFFVAVPASHRWTHWGPLRCQWSCGRSCVPHSDIPFSCQLNGRSSLIFLLSSWTWRGRRVLVT